MAIRIPLPCYETYDAKGERIATPVCALVRNDTVVDSQMRRFQAFDKAKFTFLPAIPAKSYGFSLGSMV